LEFIFEGFLYFFITFYFGWIAKEWRYVQIPCVLSGVLGVLFLLFSPESPRFLVSTKRYDEARTSLNKIAKINGMGLGVADHFVFPKEQAAGNLYLEMVADEANKDDKVHGLESTKLRDLCKNPRTRSNLCFSAVIWCALIVNYYIVAFYLKYFPGNIFANSFTMAGSDIFSYMIAGIVLKKFGLTKSIICSLLTAALGASLYLFLFMKVSLIPLFIVLCRVGNSMLLNIVYVTNSTLFPT
jgi:OCT family organic cation transporter-like MFS transporter 4/5